jgi:MFS family permease
MSASAAPSANARFAPATAGTYSNTAAWYLLGVLVTANVLSFVDRQILSLVVQPIRADLGISDTQISLLQGFAFTVLYSFLGLPLGRWADAHSRRWLIVAGVSTWSAMTMLCGLAHGYAQLFAARVGVGIGEATLAPAAFSMLCDAFASRRRGTALGIYSSAIFLGIGISVLLGGVVLAALRGATEVALPLVGVVRAWQAAFLCVGAPGLIVVALMLGVREPSRQSAVQASASLTPALTYLGRHRRLIALQMIGYACIALASYGMGSWLPTFFIRVHHWSAAQAGISYGIALTLLGTGGGILGGWLGDRWLAAGCADARLRISVFAAMLWVPLILGGIFAADGRTALLLLGCASAASSAINGLGPTTIQDIVPGWLRGQATALYFFVINLLGLGIGPTAIALVTDRAFGNDAALRNAIPLVAIPTIVVGSALLWSARSSYRRLARETSGAP